MPSDPASSNEAVSDDAPSPHATEELLRLLVDAVEDYAIFVLAPDGHILTWNPGAERAKGYTAGEIIGRHFSVFYTPEERDAGRPAWLLGQAAEHGRVEDEGWRVRKDGTRFWADVILTAIRDRSGTLLGVAKITRDLTERRQAQEQEQRLLAEQHAREAAEEALNVRERFLSIASHELKTPVAILQLAAEQLLRAADSGRLDETRLTTGTRRILRSTQRLTALVDELLDVSALSREQGPVTRTPTDVVALVEEVVARFADAAGPDRIRVEAPETATVGGDPSRLDQVITNLVDNALKYSPSDEPVEVRVVDEPDRVGIIVADRGIGLEEATEARLFEAFSRGANAGHVPGLGLGLFITHQIVERHGGRIEGGAGPDGVGATFRVWLPKDVA
jgi:PAS domain S-box-containing protein